MFHNHISIAMNQPLKILLVDDDTRNSMLLKRFIETEGYEVTYAPDGVVGLELYRQTHPDLILLDVNMPRMDGFQMAAAIRRADRHVIIFFLTDRTEKVDRLHGFSLKGNDYIPKPFYPEELVAKIRERFDNVAAARDVEYVFGDTVFKPDLSAVTYGGVTRQLSVRQTEILSLLAAGLGKVVDRNIILDTVWGDASYSNSLALNVQITYLRRLLADPAVQIISVKKKGYMLTTKD